MLSAIEQLHHYIESISYDDLPPSTVQAVKTFTLDSIGVGLSGTRVENVKVVKAAVSKWGESQQAQVWGTGEWVPATSAAIVNGFQIHNQEWDCVHEDAVVHPMATILSSLVAYAQREGMSGKQLILGIVVAVDVATLIGASVTSGLKFFRPSVCGCLGATAGMCAMQSIKGKTLHSALGIAYSQLSGTMQAHVEGSPMLAMQIGFNSASAIRAIDMAEAGFSGPADILEGQFGYFNLFEDDYDLTQFREKLGKEFQIEQVSHKPFPTGRAGHGTVDGLMTLQQQFGFSHQDIKQIDVYAPPLINRLVGRPIKTNMDSAYAKLCNGYIAATALMTGTVTVNDFDDTALCNSERVALGSKVFTHLNDIDDPNALAPVTVTVLLHSGQRHSIDLPEVLGHPKKPLTLAQQKKKFYAACKSADFGLSDTQIDNLINGIDDLPQMQNISALTDLMCFD